MSVIRSCMNAPASAGAVEVGFKGRDGLWGDYATRDPVTDATSAKEKRSKKVR